MKKATAMNYDPDKNISTVTYDDNSVEFFAGSVAYNLDILKDFFPEKD